MASSALGCKAMMFTYFSPQLLCKNRISIPTRFINQPQGYIFLVNKHLNSKILIVDDNKPTRRILKSLLHNLGYDSIVEASHGLEALQIAQNETVHIIISDWNMPNMNGLDLLKTVKSDDRMRCIAFIMVTSEDQRENIRLSVEAKVDEYIVKPFTRSVLEEKVAKVVKKCCQ